MRSDLGVERISNQEERLRRGSYIGKKEVDSERLYKETDAWVVWERDWKDVVDCAIDEGTEEERQEGKGIV